MVGCCLADVVRDWTRPPLGAAGPGSFRCPRIGSGRLWSLCHVTGLASLSGCCAHGCMDRGERGFVVILMKDVFAVGGVVGGAFGRYCCMSEIGQVAEVDTGEFGVATGWIVDPDVSHPLRRVGCELDVRPSCHLRSLSSWRVCPSLSSRVSR